MAAVSKVNMRNKVAAVAVAVTVVMLAVVATARPVKLHKATSTCPTADTYVYPYWSFCQSPAELSVRYHYVAASRSLGGLEPEYDEANSTYYVRFTGSSSDYGSTYYAVAASSTNGTLLVDSTVYIVNSESQRALQWRQEGTDEYFLIDQSVSSFTEGAPFRFVQAEDVLLPCPLIYPPAMCQAYYLISDPSTTTSDAGLLVYAEEGATYIKAAAAGSDGDLPILVISASSTASRAGMPFPTIRTVTQ